MISEAAIFKGKLLAHARTPLYGNGYALVMSSGISSVLGLLYWALAARMYTPDAVGFSAATISAMMFLAGLAQLNLMSALLRFVPEAGQQAARFIAVTYAVSMAVAAVASVVFGHSIGVFVLEDSALTGLRRAGWVPISNTGFSVAKIVLLVVLAATFPQYGVFASWTIALAGAIVLTNLVLFTRVLPRRSKDAVQSGNGLSVKTISRFVFTDYLGSLCWLACTTLLPIVVASVAGIRATAYFYLAWQIGYGLHMISINMSYSLVVEGATDPQQLANFSKRMVLLNLRIIVPGAALVAIVAPYVMGLFGAAYEAEGSNLLRLLALAAVPYSIVPVYVSIVRVQRLVRRAAAVLAVMCVMVLTLSEILLRQFGLEGVGVAWLLTQTALGGYLFLFQLRPLWIRASSQAADARQPLHTVEVGRGD
jgi:O-antigen/teichoic acid export membrane protein